MPLVRKNEAAMKYLRHFLFKICLGAVLIAMTGCEQPTAQKPSPQTAAIDTATPLIVERETRIPSGAVKITTATDAHPPQVLSAEYKKPEPVPGAVNTAGAEDSPFITPDGNTLYFFFTPDVKIPAEKQLLDGVTGIYVSQRVDGQWGKPERVLLQSAGKLALDGCEFVQGDVLWFCSAREGYVGIHWFTAQYRNGTWQDWKIADFDPDYQVGELYFTPDGSQLYFASDRSGGKGGLDIWLSQKVDNAWQEPVNVAAVNTQDADGWPALRPDGRELWQYRNYSLWRSRNVGGEWQPPEQIISPLAGEASVDAAGNVYFVHHYFKDDQMLEADIYVAVKK